MLRKSSKWQLGLVHYIAKFTILRFRISRFEYTTLCAQQKSSQPEAVKKYMGSTHKFSANKETSLAVKKTLISTCYAPIIYANECTNFQS